MSIGRKATSAQAFITGPEKMYQAVMRLGIVPFFENEVPGYSIEEMTAQDCWFDAPSMGPWDWKIELVHSGDIAYGKFLLGGKAAFATERCYRALMRCRRAHPRYSIDASPDLLAIMSLVGENGSVSVREVRELLGIKKSRADALLTRLQMSTLLITGDITRVYRGPSLSYEGWQRTSFCRPDDFFEAGPDGFFGIHRPAGPVREPQEEYDYLVGTLRSAAPGIGEKALDKLLGL